MGQFNSEDMSLLEEMVNSNFKNAMMTNNLAKLQMAQIHLAEKINSIFSQSLNQYLINQNQRFQNKQDSTLETSKGKKKWLNPIPWICVSYSL